MGWSSEPLSAIASVTPSPESDLWRRERLTQRTEAEGPIATATLAGSLACHRLVRSVCLAAQQPGFDRSVVPGWYRLSLATFYPARAELKAL